MPYTVISCLILMVCEFNSGVGLYNSIAKPRVLSKDEGEKYIDGELFEAIKETILVCQICTQINVCPRSSADCLHRFCNKCLQANMNK